MRHMVAMSFFDYETAPKGGRERWLDLHVWGVKPVTAMNLQDMCSQALTPSTAHGCYYPCAVTNSVKGRLPDV